jgi:hypothetical protein
MNLITFILVLVSIGLKTDGGCSCTKLREDEVPERGWMSVILAEKPTVKNIQGKVVDMGGKPLAGAYVEVYGRGKRAGGRAAGCRIGEDGMFCFTDIAPGNYEVRVSQEAHDTTSIIVRVNPKAKKSDKLEIAVKVSD